MRFSAFRPMPISRMQGFATAAFVAAATAGGLFGRWRSWVGSWSETASHLGDALILTLPVAAAMAAWISAAESRHRLATLASAASRPEWQVATRRVVGCWLWSMSGVLATSVVAGIWTVMEARYGHPPVLALLPIAAAVGVASAIGTSLGHWLPWLIAAPVAGVGVYVALGFLVFWAEGGARAITPFDSRWMAFYTLPAWIHVLQAMMLTTLGIALVLRSARQRRGAFTMAWLAGLLAVPLLYVGPGDRQVAEAAVQMQCTSVEGDVALCAPAGKSHLVPPLHESMKEIVAEVDGLLDLPLHVIDDETRGISVTADKELERAVNDLNGAAILELSSVADLSSYTQFDRHAFHANVAAWLFPGPNKLATDDEGRAQLVVSAQPRHVLMRWLLEELGSPIDGSARPGALPLDGSALDFSSAQVHLDWFRGISAEERKEWFINNRTQIADGSLKFAAFER